MLEAIAMLTVLAGMGFYFVKSTDLPKDMKEKSAQMRATYGDISIATAPKKYAFDNRKMASPSSEVKSANQNSNALKLAEIEKHIKKQAFIALQNKKIDELTILITSLEQEINENNTKNHEIQAQINIHLEALRTLKENIIA